MTTVAWAMRCTRVFLETVERLDDDEFDEPTALPGWTRRHVLAHVHSNAEALGRLLSWARTGIRTPMYASAEDRQGGIEAAAALPAPDLRAEVYQSAHLLLAGFHALPDEAWQAEVVTAQGRTVPASQVPWLRTRELAVHAVDLNAGTRFADLPVEVCVALVDDVARWRSGRGPALSFSDGHLAWSVEGTEPVARVVRPVAELAAWLTGRLRDPLLPLLPAWL